MFIKQKPNLKNIPKILSNVVLKIEFPNLKIYMNLLNQDFQEKKDKKSNKTILKVVLVFIILTFLIIMMKI